MLTYTHDEMQNLMDCFSRSCASFGLTINVNKTLVMYQPALNKRFEDPAIFVYGKRLKFVDHFVYLVSTLSQEKSLDWEISISLQKGTRSFAVLEKRAWSQRVIKISTKLGINIVCVLTALLYIWEIWVVYRRHFRTLERFPHNCHHRILVFVFNIWYHSTWKMPST